jgi:hypothetical protein
LREDAIPILENEIRKLDSKLLDWISMKELL